VGQQKEALCPALCWFANPTLERLGTFQTVSD
jgi:hypothetical protein